MKRRVPAKLKIIIASAVGIVLGILGGAIAFPGAPAKIDTVTQKFSSTSHDGDIDHGEMHSFTHDNVTSNYRIYDTDLDYSRTIGLVVRLHGDGEDEFDDPGQGLSSMADVARSHNMILIAPLDPSADNDHAWWKPSEGKTKWLRALIEQQLSDHPYINQHKIWWMGYSGGAEYLAQKVLPKLSPLVTGGAVMVSGGEVPESQVIPELPHKLPLYWVVGRDDVPEATLENFDAVGAALKGYSAYTTQGYTQTSFSLLLGHDHFDMPDSDILEAALSGTMEQLVADTAVEEG
ncbi:hypothetical protein BHF95_00735 [Corynebacterium diphtheriae]|uniref:hypothetical protein n=1 Tax=Corynebacterium diphtheriae TaxID=1717 RepID=UPI0008FADBF6|nr:hypothetical protein [Corynebacterium diphtheriae]OIS22358.1 hypothetical protein BHF95_00735 [Corynebacterium diphtheriae]